MTKPDPYTDRWLVRSGSLWLTADGQLTRFRDKAGAFDYGEACKGVLDLRSRHQPAKCVRIMRQPTSDFASMTRPAFVAWFAERYSV